MNDKIILIKNWIKEAINKDTNKDQKINIFDFISDKINFEFEKPCNNINDFSKRTTKNIGDFFEIFCLLYLEYYGYIAYLLKDVPEDILIKLKMVRKDFGIDIVAEKDGNYYAIQCKYKNRKNKKIPIVGWKELSTFYSLCMRTGPWKKMIVMTSANYVRRQGKVTESDLTFSYNTFKNIPMDFWKSISDYKSIFDTTIANNLNNQINVENTNIQNDNLKVSDISLKDVLNDKNIIENIDSKNDKLNEIRRKRLEYFVNIGLIKKNEI